MVKNFSILNRVRVRGIFDRPAPGILEILRWLPRTHCRKCNDPTCLVEGVKTAADCPELSKDAEHRLSDYPGRFHFED